MISTLILAAAMAAPSTAAPVNFVHGYKQGDKLTYTLTFAAEEMGMEMIVTFDLTVGATNDGKTDITLEVTEYDTGAFGQIEEEGAAELVIDVNGVPVMDDSHEGNMMMVIALMTTYLPNKRLDEGGMFEFERKNDEFQMTSKGRFSGMEEVDGTNYALLESEATVIPSDDDDATLEIKTYYNPMNKRVERTSAKIYTPDGEFSVSLKMKK